MNTVLKYISPEFYAGEWQPIVLITLAIQTPKSIRRANIRRQLRHSPLEFENTAAAILDAWGAARFKKIIARADQNVRVLRMACCGKKVCDACMIERDPERMVVCRDHWFSWERVA